MSADKSQPELPEVKELRKKFLVITEISDPLTREYQFALLEKEAEKAGLSAETYRRLYETYLRENQFIPQYPQNILILKEWLQWFLKFPKKQLVKKIVVTALEKGVLISLIFAVFKYYWEAPKREEQANYQSLQVWLMVNSAMEKKRQRPIIIMALEHLNKKGQMLGDLELDGFDLSGIKLENGKLANTSFNDTQLGCIEHKCSSFRKANLHQAQFQNAYLSKIDFQETNLIDANLQKAYLKEADLRNADLSIANLEEAELPGAKFQGADLENTKFKDAIMCGDVFDQTTSSRKYICANFIGAKNLTAEQVKSAKNWEKACYDPELRIKLGLPSENPDYCQDKLK
ncbi:pentapeptide repeat-containing protein [Dolichospermum circinale]|uniref:pentapeptide repeat-containing protein n=1 Tax=Dolichospermum circinale TaxID=109265 RepID=UPI00232A857F|nr:pentapeptide repeat-containing protein [Dolichospermum circinale]MDB9453576.1 pentapeptide repeat-containing protein [Dolichospermum circinale CS-541/06]MDB9464262.1 pentapeptide repeat-containing protein [Dolichospermum circinale CS-541/04]MDB9547238.1 pentapeptide repeat-containing protein [Dolichospermum circinale CS-1031]